MAQKPNSINSKTRNASPPPPQDPKIHLQPSREHDVTKRSYVKTTTDFLVPKKECNCVICARTQKPRRDIALPVYVLHDVEHYKQRFNWDCGLSCVLMLLTPERRKYFLDHFDDICREEGFRRATWTIDLCFLLKRFNIPHTMYSRMLGASEDYKDRNRVLSRYNRATSLRMEFWRGELCARALVEHLAYRGPAIALVDQGLLACDYCKHNKIKAAMRKLFSGLYAGHFILLVGYDTRANKILYRDPGVRPRLCAAAPSVVQLARQVPRTEQDLILVHRRYRGPSTRECLTTLENKCSKPTAKKSLNAPPPIKGIR